MKVTLGELIFGHQDIMAEVIKIQHYFTHIQYIRWGWGVWDHADPQVSIVCPFCAVFFVNDTWFPRCTTGEGNIKVIQIF